MYRRVHSFSNQYLLNLSTTLSQVVIGIFSENGKHWIFSSFESFDTLSHHHLEEMCILQELQNLPISKIILCFRFAFIRHDYVVSNSFTGLQHQPDSSKV